MSEKNTTPQFNMYSSLNEILDASVSDERVQRLKSLARMDLPEGTPEVVQDYLIKQWARQVNITYARFVAGIKVDPKDVDWCLKGAIDIHAHGGSDPFGRLLMEDEVAIDYTKAGMAGVVFKTWHTPSASRIQLLTRMMDKWASEQPEPVKPVRMFGGITLNKTVGGLNPLAVERMLKFPGMKYVWLPMVDSYHHKRIVDDNWEPGAGIELLDGNGKVKGELREIMRICADNDLVLASGHYGYKDSITVMEEARKMGVKHCELIHPTHIHSKHSIAQMKEYADMGVMVMLCALGFTCFPIHEEGPIYATKIIEQVGEDHLVFGTDYGQVHNPRHVVGVRWAAQLLLSYGVKKETIRKIFSINTAKHLDIEPAVTLDDK